MTTNTMNSLYSMLSNLGIKRSFARGVLPDWWDDTIADKPSGLQQAQLYMARAFNLDLTSLVEQDSARFREVEHKFKLHGNITQEKVSASAHFATSMAQLALTTVEKPYLGIPSNPVELRNQILANHDVVDLNALLMFCHSVGIPVLHLSNMPSPKMTALAIRLRGRFAIVLSKKGHPAYLLFYLAHELGHIAHGHLAQDGFLADEKINGLNGDDDADEKEADAYAIRLLNGAAAKYRTRNHIKSGRILCESARQLGREARVDAGHIILNCGHTLDDFKTANAALACLSVSSDGDKQVNDYFWKSNNAERLSDEQLDLLKMAMDYQ